MGVLSKLKAALGLVETVAPLLPIPEKGKRVIAKVGVTERDVEAMVKEIKTKRPTK